MGPFLTSTHLPTTAEVVVSHPNARLTIHGRRLLVDRVRSGRPVAHVADEMGISRTTAHKWVRRLISARQTAPVPHGL
ncbi:hypothetical protein J2S50_007200 [Streptomyces sp. DSM 40167]|nr:hypothetical protein [Streptomyces sp. DSM 40167]